MKVVQLGRALLVLALIPFLTILTSVITLFFSIFFRWTPEQIQILPRFWGRIIARMSGVTVRVEGLEHLVAGRPYIFSANHQSQFDIFALQGYLSVDFRWMAKKELFSVPVFGRAMKAGGYIEVDRAHGRQAMKSLDEAAKRIADGTSVIIFPEGTRSPDGNLMPFKAGGMVIAIKSGVPLVPMAIIGTHKILPKGHFLVKAGDVLIRVGVPIETNSYCMKQKHELAERLHDAVAGLIATPAEQGNC
ncbi:MAG: acyl-phosphate glycerol 3-phosphate acyltransferase [Deltaproteobacteria bacterium RIFOXYD12_FULL_50_9]|nr:MAG: acyl-phosphate glycerol 3-phosphate acyltransferase [Deltaproteobacteria bacterium RIFOXYD12_FULL_50_9]